jgi:hypothetical protein
VVELINQNTSSSAVGPVPIERKKSHRSRVLQVLTLTVVLFATVLGVAPAGAGAAGSAMIERTVFLDPYAPSGSTATVQREIYLAKGTYSFNIAFFKANEVSPLGYRARTLFIAAGTYHWSASFIKAPDPGAYTIISVLQKDDNPASISAYVGISSSADYRIRSIINN